jgi:hypothetical protein
VGIAFKLVFSFKFAIQPWNLEQAKEIARGKY